MVERGQLPGVTRVGRRVLIRSADLLHWLDQSVRHRQGVMAMSVKIRPYRHGGWEVDINVRLPDGRDTRPGEAPVSRSGGGAMG